MMEFLDSDKLCYTVSKTIQNPEIEIMHLMDQMAQLASLIEFCKEAIQEDQQRLKSAFENGGIQPDDPYPEHLEPEKLTYWIFNENSGLSTESEFNLFPEFQYPK
jgi:hypothetical protein